MLDLDLRTLFIVSLSVTMVLGFLLLFAWYQNRGVRALGWWGGCHFVAIAGVGLIGARGIIPDVISIDIANALILASVGMAWAAARLFDDRPVPISGVIGGAMLWLLAMQVPAIGSSVDSRVMLASLVIAVYTLGTGYEVWRGRTQEPLMSRWPLSAMLFVHGIVYLLRAWLAVAFPLVPTASFYNSAWLGILGLETLLFLIVASFMVLAMAKERSELVHKTNAMLDPLTNIPNRRAFLDAAMRRMRQRARNPEPVTALLFDLDHFKSINDRFGHAIGDEVLRVFTTKAVAEFRSTDIIGRLGGEEFGAILFGAGEGTAVSTAERIRRALMVATAEMDGNMVDATVSVGVAVAMPGGNEDVADLLERADSALYRAKERGRNRVEVAGKLAAYLGDEPDATLRDKAAAVVGIKTMRVIGPNLVPEPPAPETPERTGNWRDERRPARVSGS